MNHSYVSGAPVRLENLSRRYDASIALNELTLDIAAGEFFTILGPSGSGKTTTLMLIAGFTTPSAGEIYIGDRRLSRVPPHRRKLDADEPDPLRGPAGHGKWFVARKAGNHGWPYCITPQLPYRDYDFATEESGAEFDCAAPVNESPNNTGLRKLPATQQHLRPLRASSATGVRNTPCGGDPTGRGM